MTSSGDAAGSGSSTRDVDVVIVGTGILGIHQLFVTKEAGFTVTSIEAGSGVGGTWYWNRYPEARFDSESYTYGYLFSKELFDEWRWTEHFAGQPEIERYINHVVDKFDLRRHIHFNARVTSAIWDDADGVWTVSADDGTTVRARYFIPTTGVLSMPYLPEVPGRDSFEGEAYHTGLWPKHEVTFDGKRVAVIGTGSSGVQLIPAIADEVQSVTVYQRNPNWATPLNNRPITEAEQDGAAGRLRGLAAHAQHVADRVLPHAEQPQGGRGLGGAASGVLRADVDDAGVRQADPELLRHDARSGGQQGVV